MCGGNPRVCLLIFTHTHFPQNIRLELGTPSLAYFAGSNWACTYLSVDHVYFSLLLSQSLYWELLLPCHRIWSGIHDHKLFQLTARPCWDLEKYVLSVLQLVGLFKRVRPCVLTWLFPCLACGWGADWLPVVYCRMAIQGLNNVLSSPCLPLLFHPLFVIF